MNGIAEADVSRRIARTFVATAAVAAIGCGTAAAHHVMGGTLPSTLGEGLLSGLAHPVIGLDHLAALVAVGCIVAAYRRGAVLSVAYVAAMLVGAAVHVRGAMVPGAELLVGASVVALGAATVRREAVAVGPALLLFAIAGVVNGYALGESIVGAEATPLAAYLAGLALVQSGLVLAVRATVRTLAIRRPSIDVAATRTVGAIIAAAGLAVLAIELAGA